MKSNDKRKPLTLHEEQIAALDETKEALRIADIPAYSVVLKMSRTQFGVAELIHCTLDSRRCKNSKEAEQEEFRAGQVLYRVRNRYNLPMKIISTGHPFVTKKAEPKN